MSATETIAKVRQWVDNWLAELQEKIEEIEDEQDVRPATFGRPRDLEPEEVEEWLAVAYNPLADELQRTHPYRWARLKRDLKWARKEMIKLGLNPNDLRRWIG